MHMRHSLYHRRNADNYAYDNPGCIVKSDFVGKCCVNCIIDQHSLTGRDSVPYQLNSHDDHFDVVSHIHHDTQRNCDAFKDAVAVSAAEPFPESGVNGKRHSYKFAK